MVRALSRGRYEQHRSPVLDSPTTDAYASRERGGVGGGGLDGLRSIKKQSYTPRGTVRLGQDQGASSSRADLYSTPPRSPLDAARSRSRGRFARERDYDEHGDYDERRDPVNEGRSPGYGSRGGYGSRAASSAAREQAARYDSEDDSQDRRSVGGSSAHARDVLSKMRSGAGRDRGTLADRGMYTEPSKPPLRSLGRNVPIPSPRRRLDLHRGGGGGHVVDDEEDIYRSSSSHDLRDRHSENHNDNIVPASRYEVLGMKEELKKKENEAAAFRREMDEMISRHDEKTQSLRREMDEMAQRHEENVSSVRSKLVSTFKEDMQEMKTEWEEAFQRLKDESDATQRAMEMELNEATRARVETEGEMNELKTEYRSQMDELKAEYRSEMEEEKARLEEEKARSKQDVEEMELRSKREMEDLASRYRSQMDELKDTYRTQMDELKQSKEEDLERLRSMYEEHIDGTKKSAAKVESELKEEIHALLEENEKVKMCYENLETEASRAKSDLEDCKNDLAELDSNYQKALSDNLRWEKEATSIKEELDDVLDENDNRSRQIKSLEGELSDAKAGLERTSSQHQRMQAERDRFEREFDDASRERDEARAEYDDLLKKLDGIQEERTLESRYTEALVNQRDNMNAIIENSQSEIEELKDMNRELTAANERYAGLGKEFRLPNGDVATLREELSKAEQLVGLGREFHLADGENGDVIAALRDELARAEQFTSLAKEFRLPAAAASALREEMIKTSSALREESAKAEKMRDRLETLGRERERYNATVKALKYDLKALHGSNVGPETSLQEHMRLLNEKWDSNESRLRQVDKLKGELEESIQLLEENAKERERMIKEADALRRDMDETRSALAKAERERDALGGRMAEMEALDSKKKRIQEEMEAKCDKLEDRLAYVESERQELESQCKGLESDTRSLNAELDKVRSKKSGLEDALDKMEEVKKGLKKKLEQAYFDLEETQRELQSMRNDHEDEMRSFEAELTKLSKQKVTMEAQEGEIRTLREMIDQTRRDQAKEIDAAQKEVAESFKSQIRLLEEKHADQDQRNGEYLKQKHREDVEENRAKIKHLERAMKEMERGIKEKERDMERVITEKEKEMERAIKENQRAIREQKESLDQKSMVEIKRRGEFAKQKQELEILRSKERHLETHVNQLEEHISKVVADYEAKLQSSNFTTCSNDGDKVMRKQIRELEKKLEVSSAAMKQIGKSSLLMEKENERLKHDKNELKLKLKKLVDCAERFSPK